MNEFSPRQSNRVLVWIFEFCRILPLLFAVPMLFLAGYYYQQGELTVSIAVLAGALLTLAVFFISVWPQLRMDWRERRLVRHGIGAEGQILRSDFTGTIINNQPQYRVQVRYVHPGDGSEHTATALVIVDYSLADRILPGEHVHLHVSRDRPEHIAIG